jgi:hypothetical protein
MYECLSHTKKSSSFESYFGTGSQLNLPFFTASQTLIVSNKESLNWLLTKAKERTQSKVSSTVGGGVGGGMTGQVTFCIRKQQNWNKMDEKSQRF